jgi:hypothetical protein
MREEKYRDKFYKIFESLWEFHIQYPDITPTRLLSELKEGEYIECTNGFVVPLIQRVEVSKRRKDFKHLPPSQKYITYINFIFPHQTRQIASFLLPNTQYKYCPYPLAERKIRKIVNNRDKMWCRMVTNGVDMMDAVKYCYNTKNPIQQLHSLLIDDNIIDFLFSKGKTMKLLKDKAIEKGITEDLILTKIYECINSTNPTLQKYGIDIGLTLTGIKKGLNIEKELEGSDIPTNSIFNPLEEASNKLKETIQSPN